MKSYITKLSIITAMFFMTLSAFSQNPTLTKRETISYLNKKFKEAIGKSFYHAGAVNTYTNVTLAEEDENTIIVTIEVDNAAYNKKYSFVPKKLSVKESKHESDSAGELFLFSENAFEIFKNGERTDSIFIMIPFSKDDPENIKKIEKALKYLESISKEVKDPFGN